jgi:hypothetical protein
MRIFKLLFSVFSCVLLLSANLALADETQIQSSPQAENQEILQVDESNTTTLTIIEDKRPAPKKAFKPHSKEKAAKVGKKCKTTKSKTCKKGFKKVKSKKGFKAGKVGKRAKKVSKAKSSKKAIKAKTGKKRSRR